MATVADVMREVRNTFPSWEMQETWELRNTVLLQKTLLLDGDWIAIRGSARNDGIWQVEEVNGVITIPGTHNEVWDGSIWLLSPPEEFLALCREIAAWDREHPTENMSQLRFGDCGVTYAVDANGVPAGWQQVFAARLSPWRRLWRIV